MPAFDEAILLGLLYGLTEFLPLSSAGHLTLAEMLLDVGAGAASADTPERRALHACLQAAALLAALVYFRRHIAVLARDLWNSLKARKLPVPGATGWDALVLAVASLPSASLGLALQESLLPLRERPLVIGFGFIVTALLLTSTLWARAGSKSAPTLFGAALIGVAQSIACAPGLSRSAANLSTAAWLGIRAERAFELAMLATLPLLAGTLLLRAFRLEPPSGSPWALAGGAAAAFGTGLAALYVLRRVVARGQVAWFALWMLPVALATLALAKAWPR